MRRREKSVMGQGESSARDQDFSLANRGSKGLLNEDSTSRESFKKMGKGGRKYQVGQQKEEKFSNFIESA